MQKNFALMGLLILAASAIGLAVWLWNAPTHAPDGPDGGAPPVAHGDPTSSGSSAQSRQPGDRAPSSFGDSTSIVRAAVEASAEDPAGDARPCKLRVVVLSDDGPMADVQVRVLLVRPDPKVAGPTVAGLTVANLAPSELANGRTGADGVLAFTFVGGHGKRIVIHTAIGVRGATTLSADQAKELRLELTPRAVATGRVVDAANRPVADAEIVLQRWPHASTPQTTWAGYLGALWTIGRSDREGRFRIALACGGRIGARHPDHAASATYLVRSRSAAAAGSAPVQAFELLLRRSHGAVEGTVRDHLGRPVADARIALTSDADKPARAEAASLPHYLRSDASGHFRADGLVSGPIAWTADAAGHGWSSGYSNAADRSTAILDIRLAAPMQLTGTVVDADTGKPIAGVRIQAGKKHTLCFAEAITDSQGSYLLAGLGPDPGPARSGAGSQPTAQTTLSVAAKEPTTGSCTKAQIRIHPGTTQTWNVRCGAAGAQQVMLRGNVFDQRELPLAGWTVMVRQKGRKAIVGRTGDDGRFAIPLAAAAAAAGARIREVSAFAPGTPATAFAGALRRNVSVHEPVRLIVQATALASIFGRVVDHGYRGVPATISCWHHQRREYARFHADEEGRFDLAIPAGTVDLTFEHPNLVTQRLPATELPDSAQRDLRTVQLPLGGGLFGLVLGPGGAAPADCQLALTGGPEGRTIQAEYSGGSYQLSGAAPGDYNLIVQGTGVGAERFPITIEAGVDLQRDFDLRGGVKRTVLVWVEAGGGDRVTLALRSKDSALSWVATAVVQVEPGSSEGVAEFETWMQPGSYSASARSSNGFEHGATVTYERAGQAPATLRLTR